jgi:hypothetical protein
MPDEVTSNRPYPPVPGEERYKGFVRPLRLSYKHVSCGTVTTITQEKAENWARSPKLYGATFCSGCKEHFALKNAKTGNPEFLWEPDGTPVGL